MRSICFWLHRWCGLVLALYVVTISVTGALLVFHDEIASVVRVPHAEPLSKPLLNADAIVDQLKAAFPG